MKELLQTKYEKLQHICELKSYPNSKIYPLIKNMIISFTKKCNNPAIWCYGKHTKMLMTDFIFELKNVNFIIDNGIGNIAGSGFEIINESSILEKKIDGIIISSKKYRDEIVCNLKKNYSDIPYLDIYAELEKNGYYLTVEYYAKDHPSSRYSSLNGLQRSFLQKKGTEDCKDSLKKILNIYIEIKDFKSAIKYASKLVGLSNDTWAYELLRQLKEIYNLQLEALQQINEDNVIMLCVDGLRRKEVCKKYMMNLYTYIKDNMYYCTNAYSVSTSTFVSLLP